MVVKGAPWLSPRKEDYHVKGIAVFDGMGKLQRKGGLGVHQHLYVVLQFAALLEKPSP